MSNLNFFFFAAIQAFVSFPVHPGQENFTAFPVIQCFKQHNPILFILA